MSHSINALRTVGEMTNASLRGFCEWVGNLPEDLLLPLFGEATFIKESNQTTSPARMQ